MDLKLIMLNKIGQPEKDKYYIIIKISIILESKEQNKLTNILRNFRGKGIWVIEEGQGIKNIYAHEH